MSGRYRKLLIKMWGDEKFRELSSPQPNGKSLFIYLIAGPHTSSIPGLFEADEVGLASRLGWSLEGFREAFQEVSSRGMVKADWVAGLVYLPKAIVHNKPESPNVVRSWVSAYDLLPECNLREEAFQILKAFVEDMGEGFAKAFGEGFGKASRKALPKVLKTLGLSGAVSSSSSSSSYQEQLAVNKALETRPAENFEKEIFGTATAGLVPRPIPKVSSEPSNGNGHKAKPSHKAPASTEAVWAAYCGSYRARYGEPPVRNASVNTQLANFLKRIPAAEAPEIAKFYVQSNAQFYAQQGHTVFYLLRDAEKLRTEWKTGKRMTATGARSGDQREERGSIGQHLLDKAAKQREGSHA